MTASQPSSSYLSNTRSVTFLVFSVALLTSVFTLSLQSLFHPITSVPSLRSHRLSSSHLIETTTTTKKQCAFPVVYNKPAKTGSTFIQRVIEKWAIEQNRPVYICGGVGIETALRLPECLPRISDEISKKNKNSTAECGVLTNHIDIDSTVLDILNERMPHFRLITSTRYPPHRIVSQYLQYKKLNLHDQDNKNNKKNQNVSIDELNDGLKEYLENEFQPESFLPTHFGDMLPNARQCPLSDVTRRHIYNVVAKYFIVIDTNFIRESNEILKHFDLFQLSEQEEDMVNRRGSNQLVLREDVKQTLWNVSCFDREVHRALQSRMASLYETVTGKKCFKRHRHVMTSCLWEKEKELVETTWKV